MLLVPEIDASAALDRLQRLMHENTGLQEELKVLGIVRLALHRLRQSAAIERADPSPRWCAFAAGQQRGEE